MKYIRGANVQERMRTGAFAGFFFWFVITLAFSIFFLPTERHRGPRDFFVVAGMSLVGALVFGTAMAFRRPLLSPPNPELDDDDEGLGVPARLIPPSPVLGAKDFPTSDESAA